MDKTLTYAQAVHEALDLCLAADPSVYLVGLGVPDPKGLFGTTTGLQAKYGEKRVMDMPCSENAMTGVAIGSALMGMRPVMSHQRIDFALLAVEQLVNQAAKWHYMFGGQLKVPMVVRMLVGRGWGQGPQHSQSLQAWFAHIPGLKVVMPATPSDAKGLMISSIEDDNPVIFIEHRWLHGIKGLVPEGMSRVPLGKVRVEREGTDLTIVCTSYMVLEALRTADLLARDGVSAEVIDVRTLRPLDVDGILQSVRKTGRLIVADTGWTVCGFGAELVARVVEDASVQLKCRPRRIGLPDVPTPTSPALSAHFYPRSVDIWKATQELLGRSLTPFPLDRPGARLDVPDPTFKGPF